MVILFSVSWGTSILFSIVSIPNYIPTNSVGGFPFLHILSSSVQFSSVAQSCPTLCDPTDCSIPGFPVLHQLLELTQTHVHQSVMPSNHLILCCCPLLLPPSVFLSISIFSNESVLLIRWSKYWSFSFSISPSNEYSEQISFRMEWLDLLAVQGTLKSLLHHHTSRASILWPSAFFIVQLSHPYMTTGKTMSLPVFICRHFNDCHFNQQNQCEVVPHCSLDLDLYFSNNNVEHLFMYLSAICITCLVKSLFRSSANFLIALFFLILSYMNCLYILEITPLSIVSFAKFPPTLQAVSILFMVSFAVHKIVNLIRSHWLLLFFFQLPGKTGWVTFLRLVF